MTQISLSLQKGDEWRAGVNLDGGELLYVTENGHLAILASDDENELANQTTARDRVLIRALLQRALDQLDEYDRPVGDRTTIGAVLQAAFTDLENAAAAAVAKLAENARRGRGGFTLADDSDTGGQST